MLNGAYPYSIVSLRIKKGRTMSPEGPSESLPPTPDSRRTSLTDFGYKKGMSLDKAQGRLDVDMQTTKEPLQPDKSATTEPESSAVKFTPAEPKPYDWKDEGNEATTKTSSEADSLQDSA